MRMLAQALKPLVRLVDRYLPDRYVFVLILTLIVVVAAMAIESHGLIAVIGMWGNGFWDLLAFSMQMLLVLVTGVMLASTPPVKRVLVRVDYRLLVASACSGFVIWHGGLLGSIPLSIATPGRPFDALIGVIGTGQTTFAFFNLAIVVALVVVVPLVNRLMLPGEADSVYVDRTLLPDAAPDDGKIERPADRLETSRSVSWVDPEPT
jgi:short-chain fatty acids transporter